MNQQPQMIYPASNFSLRIQSPYTINDSDSCQFDKESREAYMEDRILHV